MGRAYKTKSGSHEFYTNDVLVMAIDSNGMMPAANVKNTDGNAIYSAGVWTFKNASNAATLSITNTGVVTLGPSGSADQNLIVNGKMKATTSGNIFGSANGSTSAPTRDNTNILLYDFASNNWSGIGADGSGNTYFVTGVGATQTVGIIFAAGAWTLGPSTGIATALTVNGAVSLKTGYEINDAGGKPVKIKGGDGTAIAAGYVGESKLVRVSYVQAGTVWETAASITLETGRWLLSGATWQNANNASGGTGKWFRLNDQSTPSTAPIDTTNFAAGINYFGRNEAITVEWSACTLPVVVNVTAASKTFYANTTWSGGSGNPVFHVSLQATRIG